MDLPPLTNLSRLRLVNQMERTSSSTLTKASHSSTPMTNGNDSAPRKICLRVLFQITILQNSRTKTTNSQNR